jgi:monoamine oxidase
MFDIAGINAGKRLAEKGVKDIVILEAREQIGGRMYSHDFNGITIEKGANWIEGVGGKLLNPIIPSLKRLASSTMSRISTTLLTTSSIRSTSMTVLPLPLQTMRPQFTSLIKVSSWNFIAYIDVSVLS